jgi:hypothetical protein
MSVHRSANAALRAAAWPIVLSVILTLAPGARGDTLYVSTAGRAGWSGSLDAHNAEGSDGPLPSVTAARDRIRDLRRSGRQGPMTVLVRGGTYRLEEPIVLTPEDSGTPEAPLTIAAYPGELPVLSGGQPITGWKWVKDRVWSAPTSASFHQLFVDGRRAQRARIPRMGFYRNTGLSSIDRPFVLKYRGDDIRASWAERGDVEVVILLAWNDKRFPIAKVDTANHTAELVGYAFQSGREIDARYFIENVPEGLWGPGDWYLDKKNGMVSYIPMPGEDPTQVEIIAPRLTQLVRIEGNPAEHQLVRNVTFRNLDFRHADWTLDPGGYLSQQAGVIVPAAFEAVGAEAIAVEHCRFTQIGIYALEFGRGTKHNRIVGNAIFDVGAGGVKLGLPIHVPSVAQGPAIERFQRLLADEALASHSNVIADNEMHDLGLVYPGAVGIWMGQTSKNTVAHNHVHDLYYSGISVGWTWGYGPSGSRDNIIEFNHIHNVGKNQMLSDMGGIYTLGTQPGTVVRNNLIHDVDRFVYGGWGIYADEGSCQIVYENNVVYRCRSAPWNQNYSRDLTVRNNIFAFGTEHQMTRSPRVLADLPFSFERNIVYFEEGSLTLGAWVGTGLNMDHNLFWDTRRGATATGPIQRVWESWRKLGQNEHSLIADPGFAGAASADFTLKPDSPAWRLGIQPIDLSTAGPRMQPGPAL